MDQLDTPDSCLPVSAEALGFSVYVPKPAPPEDAYAAIEESIKYKNLVGLELLSETIAKRALDPATPVRTQLEAAETMRKLAGLDKKVDAQQLGGGVSITINMPNKSRAPITFDAEPVEVLDADSETEASD